MTTRPSGSLFKAAALLAGVVLFGTFGYALVEHWSLFDSFYMTIVTITTVGGGEPKRLDVSGEWLTIAVVVVGFSALTYTVLRLMAYMVEGRLETLVGERRRRLKVARMQNHYILCGYG